MFDLSYYKKFTFIVILIMTIKSLISIKGYEKSYSYDKSKGEKNAYGKKKEDKDNYYKGSYG